MKKTVLFLLAMVFSLGVYAIEIDSCQTLNSAGEYTLNQSVSASGTCFTVTANDVLIDCAGFSVSYNTGGGSQTSGLSAADVNNVSIRNCPITDTTPSGSQSYGVFFDNVTIGTISNNTIRANGTFANRGVWLELTTYNITVANNSISVQGSQNSNIGVFVQNGASYNKVIGNTIRSQAGLTTSNYGVYVTVNTWYNTIRNNHITGIAAGSERITGIQTWNNVSHMIIENNTVITQGNPSVLSNGIQLQTDYDNVTIANNTVIVNTTTAPNLDGIVLTNFGRNVRVIGNIIVSSGSSGNDGIDLFNSSHSIIRGNTIKIGSTTASGINLRSSSANTTIDANTLNDMTNWVFVRTTSNATLTNNVFNRSGSLLRLDGPFTMVAGDNFTGTDVNITANTTFVNTTAKPFLNTSARITFANTGFLFHLPLVDIEDDGSFVLCNSPLCVEVLDTPNEFAFDVLHFTTFSMQEGAPPVPEFSTLAIFAILGLVLGGFVILRRQ